jgi:hypothetical protein
MKYEIYVDDAPVGFIDADFTRICQVYVNCINSNPTTIKDALTHVIKMMGEADVKSIKMMYRAVWGKEIARPTMSMHLADLKQDGLIVSVGRGVYRWVK